MARSKGSANLAASLEVLAGAPLDAREVVQAKSDLTASGSFPYKYIGLEVYVVAENKKYRLIANDPTSLDSWEEVGSGSGSSIQVEELPEASAENLGAIYEYVGDTTEDYIKGYFYICSEDGGTYSWVQKNVQPSGGSGGTSDYDELTNKPIVNGVTLSGSKTSSDLGLQDVFQYSTMPTASAELEGKVVQFVGTTGTYTNGYFYECVSDGEAEPTYSWTAKSVQAGGGGGGSETTKTITAAVTVGGISAGTAYPVGTELENILSDLLEPTLYPTLSNPSASLTYGASTYYAVGGTVAALTATLSLNRGSINPAYGTSGYRSGAATNFAISTSGADTEYSDSNESSGSFSVPALTRATKGTIVLTGTVNYAAGEQPKDSKGGNYSSPLAAGSVSASKTVTFIQPYYYGVSNTSTVADFTGLTESVTAKGQKTFNYTTNNQYMVMAYDSSYGNIKTILDGNGFDVTGGWTKSTVTVGGFSYFVYVSNSPTTDTNAPFTFKY